LSADPLALQEIAVVQPLPRHRARQESRQAPMKAAVYRKYGPPEVVRLEELPVPEPGDKEVLIKVHATTVSSADWRVRSLEVPSGFGPFMRPVFGLFAPRKKVLGTELAGEVVRVGRAVRRFKVGDRVFAFPGFDMGAHAEYRVMPEEGRLAPVPEGMSFEEAAALSFGGSTALHFLRDLARVRAGERVLVVGASGAVGSAAVQLARSFGAEVTGVTSTANLEQVRALGAAHVIDYTRSRFVEQAARYDVIFDTVGELTLGACKHVLNDGGRLLLAAAGLPQILASTWTALWTRGKKVIVGNAAERPEHLRELKRLAEAGAYRPLIDRTYPFAQIVDAHAYVASGRKRGSVVVTMDAA
jgi:NADPH:quinone reductase-like Zn-dependent oxidoreductase